jgi:hypothetical protein
VILPKERGFYQGEGKQIMNLLKLPPEMQDLLVGLDDWKILREGCAKVRRAKRYENSTI